MATSAPGPTPRPVVDWDAAGLPAELSTIELLARVQLDARRHGCTLRLRNAPTDLIKLIELLGLREVLRS